MQRKEMSLENVLAVYKEREALANGIPAYQERVRQLLSASVASETRRAYASRLKRFFAWCQVEGISTAFPTSPEVLAAYVASLADSGAAPATVEQTIAAIAAAHRAEEIPSPTDSLLVKKTLRGYRREHGTAPKKKDAATVEVIRMLLAAVKGDSPRNIRDAALISLGFAGAFRRSELSALDISDLKWTIRNGEEVLLINVRRSKTDQEGEGMMKAVFPGKEEVASPTSLVKRWLNCAAITEGPLFRAVLKSARITERRLSAQSIRLVILRATEAAGLSLELSAHSLRSGFVTTAIRQGKTERSIMNQTGHRSAQTLREYFRREDAVEDNAAKGIFFISPARDPWPSLNV